MENGDFSYRTYNSDVTGTDLIKNIFILVKMLHVRQITEKTAMQRDFYINEDIFS